MPRFKLTLAYDGTNFCGWQKQEPYVNEGQAAGLKIPEPGVYEPNADMYAWVQGVVHREGEDRPRLQLRTVQHVVERAVREIVREPVALLGASRTDAGVHARGQVAAFTCSGGEERHEGTEARSPEGNEGSAAKGETEKPTHSGWPLSRGAGRLRRAVNGRLPDDVQILAVEMVPDPFDPISDCVSKGYSYMLHVSPPPPRGSGLRPLWDRHFVYHVWEPLDVGLMQSACERLVGEHDFAAFAASGHGRENTVRTVHALTVTRLPDAMDAQRLRIDVSGSGFLYNMVRIIAGTLVEAGKGKMSADAVTAALLSKDRRNAGPTLGPEGLCLEWVRYQ